MIDLDYKSKSSIGYQRMPPNNFSNGPNNNYHNKMRFKKNSSDLEDIILPAYGLGQHGEAPFMKNMKSKTPS